MIYCGIFIIGYLLLITGNLFIKRVDNIKNIEYLTIIFAQMSTSICSIIIGNTQIVLGILIGSFMFYSLVYTGISMIMGKDDREEIINSCALAIIAAIVILFTGADYLINKNKVINEIGCGDGIILIIFALAIIAVLVRNRITMRNSTENSSTIVDKNDIIFLSIGVLLSVFGSVMMSNVSYKIAVFMNISQFMFAVFVLSFLQCIMPVVCFKDNIKPGVVVKVESIIFLMVLGICACIKTIGINLYNIYDIIFISVSAIIIWLLTRFLSKYTRIGGCLIVTGYVGYIIYIIMR